MYKRSAYGHFMFSKLLFSSIKANLTGFVPVTFINLNIFKNTNLKRKYKVF